MRAPSQEQNKVAQFSISMYGQSSISFLRILRTMQTICNSLMESSKASRPLSSSTRNIQSLSSDLYCCFHKFIPFLKQVIRNKQFYNQYLIMQKEEISRSMSSDSQSDDLQQGNLMVQENNKMKEQLRRAQQILYSEKPDKVKVEECLQVIQGISKDIPLNNEVIDQLIRSFQGEVNQPMPLDIVIQKAKTKMEELQKQASSLTEINQEMKRELKKLTELKISLISKIESLDAGQGLRQSNIYDSIEAEQAKFKKRMSADEREETAEENKLFAILDKFKQKYEEATRNQKIPNQQFQKQASLLQARELRINELEEINTSLKRQNFQLTEEGKVKDQQLNKEKSRFEEISAKLTNFEKQHKKLKDMQEKGDKDALKVREFQLKVKELNEELAKKKAEAKKQETLISDLTKQNTSLTKEISQKNDELSKCKDQLKKNKETLAQNQLSKSQSDKLKQDLLKRNSDLQKELTVKKDEIFSLSIRHRDEVNNHKQAIAKLTKKHQQAQEESMKLKAVSQPKTLEDMHHLIDKYLYAGKKKSQMTKAEKEEVKKKKQQLAQVTGFL